MVQGYTTPLTELPIFKKYCQHRGKYKIANELHESKLISLKVCHHHNVALEDIDSISEAIKDVVNYYTNNNI